MLLWALPRELGVKAVMKFNQDPTDPSMFQYNKHRIHFRVKCVMADALTLHDSEGAHSLLGVSPYSVLAGVPLPQMWAVINLLATPCEETLAPAQATEEIPIANVQNSIDSNMDNKRKAFEAWTIQMTKVQEPRYGGYQTARPYAIYTDHPPPHIPMGANYQQHPQYEFWPGINCHAVGHICTVSPYVHTEQEWGSVHLNECVMLSLGPRGGNGGEISRYQPETRFLSTWEYAREVTRQAQQVSGVTCTAAPQPPHPQYILRSHLFQRASSPGNWYS